MKKLVKEMDGNSLKIQIIGLIKMVEDAILKLKNI